MAEFHLQIVTPEGLKYDGQVESIIMRTVQGDVGILKNHIGYVSPIDSGKVKIKENGKERYGVASAGFIKVGAETTTLVATTFEWADEIDVERAQRALSGAEERISVEDDKKVLAIMKARKKRAQTRIAVSEKK